MAFQQIVDAALNPIFGWLLDIPSILAILFLSVLLGFVSILIQKYATDQGKLKRLKEETKKYQQQIREAQKVKDQKRMMKVQSKMMPLQLDMMKQSFRPLMFTMVPFLIIFFWLSSHFAYYPIVPGEEFAIAVVFEDGLSGTAVLNASEGVAVLAPEQQIEQGIAAWRASAEEGTHRLTLSYAGAQVQREVLVTMEREYVQPEQQFKGSVREFNILNEKILPAGQGFSLFGWKPGWIFWYIIFSIPISLGLKKLLNVV